MMREWINNRFGVNLSAADLESIRDFALVWNVFESVVCFNHCTVPVMQHEILGRNFNIATFQPIIDYFKNRYVELGATNARFDNLHFRNNDREQLVRDVLLGNVTATDEVILAIAIIVFRFRNNLFHGLKDIRVIDEQRQNFEQANLFLRELLNYYH